MKDEQLFLFPELNPFKTKIKNIDWVDISTLPYDPDRKEFRQCSALPKQKYILHKTGGINLYYPDKGAIFPWLQNMNSGKQIISKCFGAEGYPKLAVINKNRKSINFRTHRLVAMAFVENPENKKVVDHVNEQTLDYRIENLRWVSNRENCSNKSNQGEYIGVSKHRSKYTALIQSDGKRHYLGIYDTQEEGSIAYQKALDEINKGLPITPYTKADSIRGNKYKYVYQRGNKYRAYPIIDGKTKYIGSFATPELAQNAIINYMNHLPSLSN